ncbi:MAG: hypothetical protein Q9204_006501 [Flavoplaca sp. TL-2023a]
MSLSTRCASLPSLGAASLEARVLAGVTTRVESKGLVCQINDAFQGTASAGTVFADDDLKDGWTVDPINRVPFRIWNGFFKDNNFKFPEPADKVNIELRQDKPYHNKAGELIQEPIEKSIYSLYYIQSAKMMMAINIRSPSHELKIKYPSISNDDLAARLPRIHRFSDVAWKVWSGLSNNDRGFLRYIGHDYVSNPTTEALMNKVFGAAFRGDKEVP